MKPSAIYIGLKSHVTAIDQKSGKTLWTTKLAGGVFTGSPFVTILIDAQLVFAHTRGALFCLDAVAGNILWRNDLDGLGYDIANLAVEGNATDVASVYKTKQIQQQASANGGDGGSGV